MLVYMFWVFFTNKEFWILRWYFRDQRTVQLDWSNYKCVHEGGNVRESDLYEKPCIYFLVVKCKLWNNYHDDSMKHTTLGNVRPNKNILDICILKRKYWSCHFLSAKPLNEEWVFNTQISTYYSGVALLTIRPFLFHKSTGYVWCCSGHFGRCFCSQHLEKSLGCCWFGNSDPFWAPRPHSRFHPDSFWKKY